MAIWISIRFALLGVEVQPCIDPARPRAVIERGRVRLVNAVAETLGISAGLRTSTAYGICPQLEVLDADPDLETRRLAQLAELASGLSPTVCLEPPEAVLLEVAGSLHLFDGLRGIIGQLRRRYRELGHETAFGYAHTPLAATVLARAGLACRASCPGHLADEVRRSLRQVPVEHLEPVPALDSVAPSSTLATTLSTMGIRTIGQLLKLPRAPLNRRFGPALLIHLDRLTGRRSDPRKPLHPAHTFRRKAHFLEDIPDREALLFPMQRMLTELGSWLTAHQLAASQLLWQFRHENFGDVDMTVHMANAHTSPRHFLQLTRLTLERTELPERITTLILQVRTPVPTAPSTTSLFDNLPGAVDSHQPQPPQELLDLLQARLGADCCQHLARAGDHRPEHAWANTAAGNQPAGPALHARPAWLLQTPEPVNIHQLRVLRGPERIHAGWWEGRLAEAPPPRDYYAAQQSNGALCWVFRPVTGNTDEWFIHGWFG